MASIDYLSIIPAEVFVQDRRSEVSPEVKLAAAVLLRAISDARGELGAIPTDETAINDAIAWLTGSGDEIHEEYFDFWVKEALQLDPELVRAKLLPRLGLDIPKDTESELRRHKIQELEAKAAEMNRLRPSRSDVPRMQQDQRWLEERTEHLVLCKKPEVAPGSKKEEPVMELMEQLNVGLALLDKKSTDLESQKHKLEEQERKTEMELLRVGSEISGIEGKRTVLEQAVKVLQELAGGTPARSVVIPPSNGGDTGNTARSVKALDATLPEVITSFLVEASGVKMTVDDVFQQVIARGYQFKPYNKDPRASIMATLSALTAEGRIKREPAPYASGVSVRKKVYWVDKE